ncbi:methyltransferase domain-containing protein [Paenarthrobacter ureafaciens]
MLEDAIAVLRCPVCGAGFQTGVGQVRGLLCASGHAFDAAKQGYFNLLTGKGTVFEADTADMVSARQRFLDGGHYAPLSDAVAELAAQFLDRPEALVLDAGTGTGHYLNAILQECPVDAIGLDISKFALRRAARVNPQVANIVWDIWRPLPVADASVDVVLVVFAPRNAAEFARVLRPGGRLVIVTPRQGHLAEAAARTGMLSIQQDKEERLASSLGGHFSLEQSGDLDVPLTLDPGALADLAFMGPAGHHRDAAELAEQARTGGPLSTTAKFSISVFTLADMPS